MAVAGEGFGGPTESRPIERFRPTTGAFVGWTGITLAVLAIGFVVVVEHSLPGLRLALGAAFGAVLVWATQLRPRATAYARHLRLHGSLRDVDIPYVLVNQVAMGQTLNVWAGGKRYVCVGIGRSIGMEMRQRVRSRGDGAGGVGNRSYQFAGRTETTVTDNAGTRYDAFVLDRINDLVAVARAEQDRSGRSEPDLSVRHTLALPEIVALTATGLAFLASVLV